MNKFIKLIIPVALLLTTNAFARQQNSGEVSKEALLFAVPLQISNNIKTALDKAYIDNNAAQKDVKENIKALCKDNKHCLTNADLMLRAGISSEQIITVIQSTADHKQALYNTKYSFAKKGYSLYENLQMLEIEQIAELNSFKEIRAYMTDLPLLIDSFDTALELLDLYLVYGNISEEELNSIKAFKQNHSTALPPCPRDLDIKKYGYDTLCFIPENHAAKKQLIKKMKNSLEKMTPSQEDEDGEQNQTNSLNGFEQAKEQIKQLLKAWQDNSKNPKNK